MRRLGWYTGPAAMAVVFLATGIATAQWSTVFQAGAPGRGWPQGETGGGPNVNFVQENGNENPPPGDPNSPAADQQADDDYYFAGDYPDPIGNVAANEEAFERAFVPNDPNLRIHFNLDSPNPSDQFRFSLEPFNLHTGDDIPNPRYGVSVLFNDVVIMPETVVTPAELNTIFTSEVFSASDVNAVDGANVVLVKGTAFNEDGGGSWMGMDYHHLETVPEPGTLGMMFSGLIWTIPFACYERNRGRKQRK